MTERQTEYLLSLPPPEDEPDQIYLVRGYKTNRKPNDRFNWVYEGRGYNCRDAEILDVSWMSEAGMDKIWRMRTVHRNPKHWFRVPVQAKRKTQFRKPVVTAPIAPKKRKKTVVNACVALKKRKKQFPKPVVTTPMPKKAVQSLSTQRPAACTANCLIKFFDRVGLNTFRDRFRSIGDSSPSFPTCIRIMRKLKKFGHKNLHAKSFDPYRLEDNILYLFQLCATHVHTEKRDNTHAICVYNSLIYDANMSVPLDYNVANLNACCLGGEIWVFHHMSRIVTFTPTLNVNKFIAKHTKPLPSCK